MRPFFMIKKSYKKENNTFLWIFIFLSIFLLLNLFLPISNPVKNTIFNIIAPIQKTMTTTGNNIFPVIGVFRDTKKVTEELNLLRSENSKLLSALAKTKILEEENNTLRSLLNLEKEEDNVEVAEVLGRKMGGHFITVQHKNKVNIDSAVTTPEGVLVGFVVETNKNISKVRLLTNKESALEVKIINENNPIGVLKGNDKKTLHIETLPKNQNIERGDLVVGQSYNGIALGDIYVGRIINITDHDVEPFLSADVYQGVDLRYINYLFIENK